MNLAREQAIAEHRKMWDWIADEIKNRKKVFDIHDLKHKYLKINGFKYILGGCFLCEYSESIREGCSACPLKPKNGNPECLGGLFWECVHEEDWQEQAKLSRQIANLPEREDI